MSLISTETFDYFNSDQCLDPVAPWRSVDKLHFQTDTDLTFSLKSGGHNAGIVSESGHASRHCRVSERLRFDQEYYVDTDSGWVTPVQPTGDLGRAPSRDVLEK